MVAGPSRGRRSGEEGAWGCGRGGRPCQAGADLPVEGPEGTVGLAPGGSHPWGGRNPRSSGDPGSSLGGCQASRETGGGQCLCTLRPQQGPALGHQGRRQASRLVADPERPGPSSDESLTPPPQPCLCSSFLETAGTTGRLAAPPHSGSTRLGAGLARRPQLCSAASHSPPSPPTPPTDSRHHGHLSLLDSQPHPLAAQERKEP